MKPPHGHKISMHVIDYSMSIPLDQREEFQGVRLYSKKVAFFQNLALLMSMAMCYVFIFRGNLEKPLMEHELVGLGFTFAFFFGAWFLRDSLEIDFHKQCILRCKGNKFSASKEIYRSNSQIDSFGLDFKGGKHPYWVLVMIDKEGMVIPVSKGQKFKLDLAELGEELAKAFGKPFHCQEDSAGLMVSMDSSGNINVDHRQAYQWSDIKWKSIALVMTPIIILFVWMIYFVRTFEG